MWHKPSQKHEKLPFTAWSKFGNIWLQNPGVKNDVIYKSKDLWKKRNFFFSLQRFFLFSGEFGQLFLLNLFSKIIKQNLYDLTFYKQKLELNLSKKQIIFLSFLFLVGTKHSK